MRLEAPVTTEPERPKAEARRYVEAARSNEEWLPDKSELGWLVDCERDTEVPEAVTFEPEVRLERLLDEACDPALEHERACSSLRDSSSKSRAIWFTELLL